jgi:branched-chain amino acid transport system permease protein
MKATRRARSVGAIVALVVVLLPLLVPHPFVLTVATQALIWALLAASWDLLSGYAGQVSFGHAGFFVLGGYTAAITSKSLGLSAWVGVWLGALLAAGVGLAVGFPALRLRGHYLALITLGFAEILRLVAQNWLSLTGGPFGIYGYGTFSPLPADPLLRRQVTYTVVLLFVAGSVAAMALVCERTPAGKAFRAIREDELLAATLGINTTRYKLLAFALSSAFAGLAGTLYAYYVLLVSPTLASPATTALVIGMAVFGGLGTIWGPAAGALLLYAVNEGLRFIGVVYNLIVVGLVIMVFVIFLPEGLAGLVRPRRAAGLRRDARAANATPEVLR